MKYSSGLDPNQLIRSTSTSIHSRLYFDLYKYLCEYFRDLCIFDEASIGAGTTQLYRSTGTWVVAKSRSIAVITPSIQTACRTWEDALWATTLTVKGIIMISSLTPH